jgi:acyl-CoA reductase-like NAD-dependent aldehyde dehydrogenase
MSAVQRCISPVDGSVLFERPVATAKEISACLQAASRAQDSWRGVPIKGRAEACSRVVDAMLEMTDSIVPELAWQMGRPIRYGAGELSGFAERARHMISIAAEALAPVRVSERRYILREPVGLVFVIAPWNYPYLTAVNSVIPALMAGNAVILKHARQTLLVGDRFEKACRTAGLPEGLFSHLVLSHSQAAEVMHSGAVAQVNFTGSVAGGTAVSQAAAPARMGVGLELGGKDPAYVRADADLAFAVDNLVDGAFFNSGQSCCGIERIYVDHRLFDDFVGAFASQTASYSLGSPLDEATTLGPLVSEGAADFVRGQVSEAMAHGATALVEPTGFPGDGGAYLAPQVLVDVNHEMRVMTEESFGPVVGIMPVQDDAEALRLMNDSPFGLTASIWTADLGAAASLGQALETGTVFANRCDYLDPALAWTGVKDSGRGATLSRVGYETLTRPKSFHLREQL